MHPMANISPVRYTTAFQMRADVEFIDALDELRLAEKPEMSRADMLRRLVYEETQRRLARRERQKEKA